MQCHRRAAELEKPTDFSSHHLRLAPSQRSLFWETVVSVDGTPACFAHEWAADESVLRAVAGPTLIDALGHPTTGIRAEPVRDSAAPTPNHPGPDPDTGKAPDTAAVPTSTMLAVFLDASPRLAFTARSTLSATVLGEERGQAILRSAETPALLFTQTVSASGQPILSAKYLFPAGAPQLALTPRH